MPEIRSALETTDIDLDFYDIDLGQSLIDSAPIEGIKVSNGGTSIRASAPAEIVITVSLKISHGIELAAVAIWLATQIAKSLRKYKKDKTRINNAEVRPTNDEILAVLRDAIHWQQVREAQWNETQQRKLSQGTEPSPKAIADSSTPAAPEKPKISLPE